MKHQDQPAPPKHLTAAARRWWLGVLEAFILDPHHVPLLTLAAQTWDRGEESRKALAKHGTTFLDRFGQPRARPEVAIERDCRLAFARLLRELALDVEPPAESRPPSVVGRASLRVEN